MLRAVGTKAVDAALLLARMLVPEPMRPGWANVLRMSASRMPHAAWSTSTPGCARPPPGRRVGVVSHRTGRREVVV